MYFDFKWHEPSRMWVCGDMRIIERNGSLSSVTRTFTLTLGNHETTINAFDFYLVSPQENDPVKRANEILDAVFKAILTTNPDGTRVVDNPEPQPPQVFDVHKELMSCYEFAKTQGDIKTAFEILTFITAGSQRVPFCEGMK